jgi:hypothetical protein
MRRRTLLAGGIAAAVAGRVRIARADPVAGGPAGVPASGRLAFDVIREGDRIGTHTMRFTQSGGQLTIETEVAMDVGVGPLKLFRYRHHAVERWQDGRFAALDTRTDDDGTPVWVQAVRQPDAVRILAARGSRTAPPLLLPAGSLPLTHWNIAVTRAPLFDPQDGVAAQERVVACGPSAVACADGSKVRADRFDFTGKAALSDWYDAQSTWTALRATVKDGSILEYRRAV